MPQYDIKLLRNVIKSLIVVSLCAHAYSSSMCWGKGRCRLAVFVFSQLRYVCGTACLTAFWNKLVLSIDSPSVSVSGNWAREKKPWYRKENWSEVKCSVSHSHLLYLSLVFTPQPRWLGEFQWVTGRPGCSWWLGGHPQMGSVTRGRWRSGLWGALSPTNGMASWAWLLAAVLLSLLTVSAARPPLTATKEEEAALEPEGKQQKDDHRGGDVRWQPFVGFVFSGQV